MSSQFDHYRSYHNVVAAENSESEETILVARQWHYGKLVRGFKDATWDCGALAVAAAFVDEADAVYSVRTSPLRSVPPTV
jgi:hypothetical protein